jgi:hypothetical protein
MDQPTHQPTNPPTNLFLPLIESNMQAPQTSPFLKLTLAIYTVSNDDGVMTCLDRLACPALLLGPASWCPLHASLSSVCQWWSANRSVTYTKWTHTYPPTLTYLALALELSKAEARARGQLQVLLRAARDAAELPVIHLLAPEPLFFAVAMVVVVVIVVCMWVDLD